MTWWRLALAAVPLWLAVACAPVADDTDDAGDASPLSRLLASDDAGFAQATRPASLAFPEDHGPHPSYRIEWWYVTAVVRDVEDRRFGVQLALFRFALRPGSGIGAGWSSAQVFMSHAAISDIDGRRFRFAERFARPAVGMAGAASSPTTVWVHDCRLAADGTDGWSMRCAGDGFAYDLALRGSHAPTLHGEAGFSRKSDAPGSASYYYSYPFLDAAGELIVDGERFAVDGSAWMDHEWSSSVLARTQAGWDWFSLRFDDGRALMLFRIRGSGGEATTTRGSFIDRDGVARPVPDGAIRAEPLRTWTSPGGIDYPVAWRLTSTSHDIDLAVDATMDAQALDASVRYWEGVVTARGRYLGTPASGEGYVELTGYDAVRR